MNTLDDAFNVLAKYNLAFIGVRDWDIAVSEFSTYSKMASAEQYFIKNDIRYEEGGFEDDTNAIWDGLDAALFIRDEMLKLYGKRIWKLTFTLCSDGKFNIDYDYNKPKDYEETDDKI